MAEFFTWQMMATLAGASITTGLVTGFIDKLWNHAQKVPTQLIAYFVALCILMCALAFTGALSASSGVLSLFNALVVSSATSGTIGLAKRLVQ